MAYTPSNTNVSKDGATEPASVQSASFWPQISDIPAAPVAPPDNSTTPTTPVAPTGGTPPSPTVPPGMPTTPVAPGPNRPVGPGVPTTPVAPGPNRPVGPGVPTTPVAPPPYRPVPTYAPSIPMPPVAPSPNRPSGPGFFWPTYPLPSPNFPSVSYYGQVRFLNASTNGETLDVYIDNQRILSGSTFATVSIYISVNDGFHTVTIRQTSGQILYQQSQAFVSGEKLTMVILDAPGGVTLARVSDMGCTNLPSGYGCMRVANMSYSGSNYDVRLFNNQTVFAGVGYKEVTSYKQTSAGNYTFYVTNSQVNFTAVRELPIIIFSALVNPGCTTCGVNNPLLTFSVNIQAGRAYTSYIIGNPWSNLYQVFTMED